MTTPLVKQFWRDNPPPPPYSTLPVSDNDDWEPCIRFYPPLNPAEIEAEHESRMADIAALRQHILGRNAAEAAAHNMAACFQMEDWQ